MKTNQTCFKLLLAGVVALSLVSCASTPKASYVESYSAMGTFKDSRDGREYKTVTIGSQVWMAENLKYVVEDSHCYNDLVSKCDDYGRLYSWSSAKENKLCPDGWHIPNYEEWEILSDAVGGKDVAGQNLRSSEGWGEKNNGKDNYKFTVRPTGFRHRGSYEGVDEKAYFWLNGDFTVRRVKPFVNGKYVEYDNSGRRIEDEQPARGVLMFNRQEQEVKSKLWRVHDIEMVVNDQKFDPNNEYANDFWLSVRCVSDTKTSDNQGIDESKIKNSDKRVNEENAESSVHSQEQNQDKEMALFLAIKDGSEIVVDSLIRNGADVNWKYQVEPNVFLTPLIKAIVIGNVEIVKQLINAGTDFNIGNSTPFRIAASRETAMCLSENSQDSVFCEKYREIVSILEHAGAVYLGSGSLILDCENPYLTEKMLLDVIEHGADVNESDSVGRTPLLAFASWGKNPNVLKILIQKGALVNAMDKDGRTAFLKAAAFNPNPEFLNVLIAAGADIKTKNSRGANALLLAAGNNNLEVVSMLLKTDLAKKLSEQEKKNVIEFSVLNPDQEVLKLLIKKGFMKNQNSSEHLKNALESRASLGVINVLLNEGKAFVDDKMMQIAQKLPMNSSEERLYRNQVIDALSRAKKDAPSLDFETMSEATKDVKTAFKTYAVLQEAYFSEVGSIGSNSEVGLSSNLVGFSNCGKYFICNELKNQRGVYVTPKNSMGSCSKGKNISISPYSKGGNVVFKCKTDPGCESFASTLKSVCEF